MEKNDSGGVELSSMSDSDNLHANSDFMPEDSSATDMESAALLGSGSENDDDELAAVSLLDDDKTESSTTKTKDPAAFPVYQIVVLLSIMFVEGYNLSSLFPYVYFYVHDVLPDVPESQLGYYVGFLASAFSLGQFISGTHWGKLSDRKGRRIVLLLGLFFNSLLMICFGLSMNFPLAIFFRFMCGLLNANVAAGKTYLAEVTPTEHADRAFSYLSLTWGLSSIIGPLAGGVLARPADKYPNVFSHDGLFGRFPYLLPTLVSVLVSMCGFSIGYYVLKDPRGRFSSARGPQYMTLSSAHATEGQDDEASAVQPEPPKSVFADRLILRSIAVYAILAFTYVIFDEVGPLFFARDRSKGGLGFDSTKIGVSQAVAGVSLAIFQSGIYSSLAKRFGRLNMLRFGLSSGVVFFLIFPMLSYATKSDTTMWIVLIAIMSIRPILSTCAFTSIFVLINNAATADVLGTVNGAAQAAASLFRAIGPISGGSIFAWSVGNGLSFPFDFHFVFFILAVIGGCNACLSFSFSQSINKPRSDAATTECEAVE